MVSADAVPPSFRHPDVTASTVVQRAGVWARGRSRRARARRWAGRALVLLPGALVVAYDVALRHDTIARVPSSDALHYLAAAVVGVLLWTALLVGASARRGGSRWGVRAALVALAFVAIGGQIYTFRRYHAFLNTQSMLVGTEMLPSIRQQLWVDRVGFLSAVLPPVGLVLFATFAAQHVAPPRRAARRIAIDAATGLLCVLVFAEPFGGELEVAPFDALYLNGLGQLARAVWDKNPCLARAHPGRRSPIPVPPLVARPARPRNVLLVLTESVRAASSCVAYDPECRITPFSNEAARDRIPLMQMRSVDSTTAISLGVLWSGISPDKTRQALHSAPLVWEYANAAGVDTAYWTSQHLLFGNSGAWLEGIAWGHHVSASELEPSPSLETGADDGALVTYVNDQLETLREPFFAVVHLSNTHMPYAIDDSDAPFLPQGASTGAGHEAEVSNRYADAIYHQDRAIGRLLSAVHATPSGARTVIVFLSDHGEQLYEKGAYGHTGTLYEPEIHIPAWVVAPPGTLSPAEDAQLRALRDAPLTTMDVLPTLLDLVGVLDDPALAPLAAGFVGRSLLRGGSPADAPVVLTNCSELWACAFRNWGAMAGTQKLIGKEGDHAWSCFDLQEDPDERDDLGPDSCGTLRALAETRMHGRPF